MARELKIFPYGRNIAVVVSAVMEKDRQDAARKCRMVTRVGTLSARRRRHGEARSLPPLAVANHRRLRSRPPPGPASLRRVQGLLLLVQASCPRTSSRRSKGRRHRRALTFWQRVLPTLTQTSAWGIISLVSFYFEFFSGD
jgi:hypothetical protein